MSSDDDTLEDQIILDRIRALKFACKYGSLADAKQCKLQWSEHFDIAGKLLQYACENGHLDIAEWLIERFEFNSNLIEVAFYNACMWEHLEVAKWLIKRFNLNTSNRVKKKIRHIFILLCNYGSLEIAQWLRHADQFGDNIVERDIIIEIFHRAYKSTQSIYISQWLIDQYNLTPEELALNTHADLYANHINGLKFPSAASMGPKFAGKMK
jgi:Ankyrin repeats (3 copies)